MKNKLIEAAIFIKNWCATRGVYDEKECPEEIIYNSDTDKNVTHQGLARFFNRDIM